MKQLIRIIRKIFFIINSILIIPCLFLFIGCSTNSKLTTIPEEASIKIGRTNISGIAPLSGDISRTTFGKYPVMVEKEGYETLYAILPMNVGGGVIAADVLLFAPAVFWNAQGAFSFYEFDLEKGIIRYKEKDPEEWKEYEIPAADQDKAKRFFR